MEVHGAWAVSLQSVAGRPATPLGHIKKKKKTLVWTIFVRSLLRSETLAARNVHIAKVSLRSQSLAPVRSPLPSLLDFSVRSKTLAGHCAKLAHGPR